MERRNGRLAWIPKRGEVLTRLPVWRWLITYSFLFLFVGTPPAACCCCRPAFCFFVFIHFILLLCSCKVDFVAFLLLLGTYYIPFPLWSVLLSMSAFFVSV